MLPRRSVRVLLHPGALRGFGNRHSFPLGGCDWQYAGPAPPGPCPSPPQWHVCLQDAVCRGTEACSLSGEKRSFTRSRCSWCEHQALGCILIHPASKQALPTGTEQPKSKRRGDPGGASWRIPHPGVTSSGPSLGKPSRSLRRSRSFLSTLSVTCNRNRPQRAPRQGAVLGALSSGVTSPLISPHARSRGDCRKNTKQVPIPVTAPADSNNSLYDGSAKNPSV